MTELSKEQIEEILETDEYKNAISIMTKGNADEILPALQYFISLPRLIREKNEL